jgi:hypothetical protein
MQLRSKILTGRQAEGVAEVVRDRPKETSENVAQKQNIDRKAGGRCG